MKKLFLLLAAVLLAGTIAPAAAQPKAAVTPPRYDDGGLEKFTEWLATLLICPETVKEQKSTLRLFFTVEPDGSMSSVRLLTRVPDKASGSDFKWSSQVDPALAEEVNRVLAQADPWTPAYRKSKPVRSKYHVDLVFRKGQVDVDVSREPQFNGGDILQFNKWLDREMDDLINQQQSQIAGRIVIQFVIDEEGHATNPLVLENANPTLNKALYERLNRCPQWEPAIRNGAFIPFTYNYTYTLQFREAAPSHKASHKESFVMQPTR